MLVSELLDALEADLKLRQVRSLKGLQSHLKQVRSGLADRRAIDVSAEVVDRYIEARLSEKEAPAVATVNRETGLLAQAFKLGIKHRRIGTRPDVRKLSEKGNARQGFFEKAQFDELLKHLPKNLKSFVQFGYYSGWRKGEIGSLQWSDVDLAAKVIRLQPANSKTKEGRVLVLDGDLWAVIDLQRRKREYRNRNKTVAISQYVFHRDGEPIREFRKAWATACVAAGLGRMVCPKCNEGATHSCKNCGAETKYVGRIFHDFRCSAVRNMVRAGVPERVAMAISGHKTRAIFDRYNIVNEDDLRAAMERTQAYLKATPQPNVAVLPTREAAAK